MGIVSSSMLCTVIWPWQRLKEAWEASHKRIDVLITLLDSVSDFKDAISPLFDILRPFTMIPFIYLPKSIFCIFIQHNNFSCLKQQNKNSLHCELNINFFWSFIVNYFSPFSNVSIFDQHGHSSTSSSSKME